MIGFVTNKTTADLILAGIDQTMKSHGQPTYWTTGAYPIHTGDDAGQVFIPASDELLATPLRGGMTPLDFPETHAMLDTLGGLESRTQLDPKDIQPPEEDP